MGGRGSSSSGGGGGGGGGLAAQALKEAEAAYSGGDGTITDRQAEYLDALATEAFTRHIDAQDLSETGRKEFVDSVTFSDIFRHPDFQESWERNYDSQYGTDLEAIRAKRAAKQTELGRRLTKEERKPFSDAEKRLEQEYVRRWANETLWPARVKAFTEARVITHSDRSKFSKAQASRAIDNLKNNPYRLVWRT